MVLQLVIGMRSVSDHNSLLNFCDCSEPVHSARLNNDDKLD